MHSSLLDSFYLFGVSLQKHSIYHIVTPHFPFIPYLFHVFILYHLSYIIDHYLLC